MPKKSKIMSSKPIQDLINTLYAKGTSYTAISNEIKKKGVDVSHMAVKRYIDQVKVAKGQIVSNDQQLTQYVQRRLFNSCEELKKIHEILWDMVNHAKVTNSFKITLIRELRSVVKLSDDIMKEFRGITQSGPQGRIHLFHMVIKQLKELEEKGQIKILDPIFKQKIDEVKREENDERKD